MFVVGLELNLRGLSIRHRSDVYNNKTPENCVCVFLRVCLQQVGHCRRFRALAKRRTTKSIHTHKHGHTILLSQTRHDKRQSASNKCMFVVVQHIDCLLFVQFVIASSTPAQKYFMYLHSSFELKPNKRFGLGFED